MKNEKTPIEKWLEENRWTIKAVSDSTGMHYQTVYMHVNGRSFPREAAIAMYKEFGIPRTVIHAHLAYMADKA